MHLVPVSAFLLQLGIAALGAMYLLPIRRHVGLWGVAALGYPLAAIGLGAIQTIAFVLGHAGWIVPASALLVLGGCATAATAIRADLARTARAEQHRIPREMMILATTVAAAVGVAVLVTGSSDLDEPDPRWQWAYRAKIMASFETPDNPLITDATVLHINRRYPLFFSGLEAVTLRAAGNPDRTEWLRPVELGFFVSVLLLIAWASLRAGAPGAGVVVLLLWLTLPKLWGAGLDEVYADLPLGAYALALVLVLRHMRPSRAQLPIAFLLGLGLGGTKSEGAVLALAIVVSHLLQRSVRTSFVETCRTLIPLAGVALALLVHLGYWHHIPANLVMENVSPSDIHLIPSAKIAARYAAILAAYATTILRPAYFGLFWVITLLALAQSWSRQARIAGGAALSYLGIMTIPFLFTRLDLAFHLGVVLPRFGVQVGPMALLVVLEGVRDSIVAHTSLPAQAIGNVEPLPDRLPKRRAKA